MLYSIRFTVRILFISAKILIRRKRVSKRSQMRLKEIENNWKGQFDRATYYKIYNSQAIYIPAVCDAFASLRGVNTTFSEEERFLHYFICSSLFDNFWDRKSLTIEQLRDLSFSPETYTPHNFDETVFQYAHQWLLKRVDDQESYMKVAYQVFHAQQDSLRQMDATIGWGELISITERKGGFSVELCAFYLDGSSSPEIRKLWFRLGALIQLTNDLYDVFKDSREGMYTLPICMKRVADVRLLHNQWTEEIRSLIHQISFPSSQKEICSIHLMCIAAFGKIALDQFEALEKRDQTLQPWSTYTRKELIIDMELWKNLWKGLRLTYQMASIKA